MKRKWRWLLFAIAMLIAPFVLLFIQNRPWDLVFMDAHRHCMVGAKIAFMSYSEGHEGRFPSHPDGYGNALLLLNEDCFYSLTGPGYDGHPFHEAKRTGNGLAEADCGRVYIQGLNRNSNPDIAILFDKLPTPGGDHCRLPLRIWRPLGREVLTIGGMHFTFVPESEWPEFSKRQIELLVEEGFDRQEAERLYASKPQ